MIKLALQFFRVYYHAISVSFFQIYFNCEYEGVLDTSKDQYYLVLYNNKSFKAVDSYGLD